MTQESQTTNHGAKNKGGVWLDMDVPTRHITYCANSGVSCTLRVPGRCTG